VHIGGVDYPDDLWNALCSGRVVIFGGAGVSMGPPANLPDFAQLTREIVDPVIPTVEELTAPDVYLGKQRIDVKSLAARALNSRDPRPTPLHVAIVRLFKNQSVLRVVTSNFDTLFESAANAVFSNPCQSYSAPALPSGARFSGVVHVHGSLQRPEDMVLRDTDFGLAYLTEGWARRFLLDVFRSHDVLFVGYSHRDTIARYLARSIPPGEQHRRFALVAQGERSDRAQWESLNINPIYYPQHNHDDHARLVSSVSAVADRLSWSLGTWRAAAGQMLSVQPPDTLDDTAASLLDQLMNDADRVRLLLKSHVHPGWLHVFHARGYLRPLFNRDRTPTPADAALSTWLASQIRPQADQLLALLRRSEQLNPTLWHDLLAAVSSAESVPAPALRESAHILIASATHRCDLHCLTWLGSACARSDEISAALSVFFFLVARALEDHDAPRDMGHALASSWSEIWPKAHDRAAEILSVFLACLERRARSSELRGHTWAGSDLDLADFYAAFEDEDFRSCTVTAAAQSVLDCLSGLSERHDKRTDGLLTLFVGSASPLCRLLGVRGHLQRTDVDWNCKLAWLIQNADWNDITTLREIAPVVSQIFAAAGTDDRAALVDVVRHIHIPRDEHEDLTHLAQILVLRSCASTGFLDDDAEAWLKDLEFRHPAPCSLFRRSGVRSRARRVRSGSPWSARQLLGMQPEVFWAELDHFSPVDADTSSKHEIVRYDHRGIAHAVREAVCLDVRWGVRLAEVMAAASAWDSALWPEVLHGWADEKSTIDDFGSLLPWLSRDELQEHHTSAVADAIKRFVSQDVSAGAIPALNEIAAALEKYLSSYSSVEANDVLVNALSHPAGVVAEYWLESLDTSRKRGHQTTGLDDEYRDALTRLTASESSWVNLSRAVVGAQFDWLLNVDARWTTACLLPLFQSDDREACRAVWHGFLTWGRLSPPTVAQLTPSFLRLLSTAATVDPHGDRLLDFAATIITFDNAIARDAWFSAVLAHTSSDQAEQFAFSLGKAIAAVPDEELAPSWNTWISRYWSDRNDGRFAPITPREAAAIVDWLPDLGLMFDEAVRLACKMPPPELTHGSVLRELADGDLPAKFPAATWHLLRYLDSGSSKPSFWAKAEDLLTTVRDSDLEPSERAWLDDFALRRGLA